MTSKKSLAGNAVVKCILEEKNLCPGSHIIDQSMEAAQSGNLEKLESTYPEGCDADSVNRKDEDGRTPLVRSWTHARITMEFAKE
jgi:hypothetical protein